MKKSIILIAVTIQLTLSSFASDDRKNVIPDEDEFSCSEIKPIDYHTKGGNSFQVYPEKYLDCLKGVEKQNVIIIDVMGV